MYQDLEGQYKDVILVMPKYSYLFDPFVFKGMIDHFAEKIIKTDAPLELFQEEEDDKGRGSSPGFGC